MNDGVPGYSAISIKHSLIIKSIAINDKRNGTEYRCVIVIPGEYPGLYKVVEKGDKIILYVAGE